MHLGAGLEKTTLNLLFGLVISAVGGGFQPFPIRDHNLLSRQPDYRPLLKIV